MRTCNCAALKGLGICNACAAGLRARIKDTYEVRLTKRIPSQGALSLSAIDPRTFGPIFDPEKLTSIRRDELREDHAREGALADGKLREALKVLLGASEKCRHWHDTMRNDKGETEGVVIAKSSWIGLKEAEDVARRALADGKEGGPK